MQNNDKPLDGAFEKGRNFVLLNAVCCGCGSQDCDYKTISLQIGGVSKTKTDELAKALLQMVINSTSDEEIRKKMEDNKAAVELLNGAKTH